MRGRAVPIRTHDLGRLVSVEPFRPKHGGSRDTGQYRFVPAHNQAALARSAAVSIAVFDTYTSRYTARNWVRSR